MNWMARAASQMTYSVPFGCVDDQVYWLCTIIILEMIRQHIPGFVSKLHGWPKLNHRLLTRVLIISDRWVCSNILKPNYLDKLPVHRNIIFLAWSMMVPKR